MLVTEHGKHSSAKHKTLLSTMCEFMLKETEPVLEGGNSMCGAEVTCIMTGPTEHQPLLRTAGLDSY